MDFWKKACSLKRNGLEQKVESAKQYKSEKHRWKVGLIIGLLFLVIGFGQEQFTDLYHKAVMICLECIGIG